MGVTIPELAFGLAFLLHTALAPTIDGRTCEGVRASAQSNQRRALTSSEATYIQAECAKGDLAEAIAAWETGHNVVLDHQIALEALADTLLAEHSIAQAPGAPEQSRVRPAAVESLKEYLSSLITKKAVVRVGALLSERLGRNPTVFPRRNRYGILKLIIEEASIDISIDGQPRRGRAREYLLPEGPHEVVVKTTSTVGAPKTFVCTKQVTAEAGATVELRCP